MKLWFKQATLMFWLLAALFAALPVLAYWQYRWLGEVSQAERERMQRNLKTSAAQFAQEFDQELTLAYVSLQDAQGPFATAEPFAERYRRWAATAPHPQLVRAIFTAALDEEGQFSFQRFEPTLGAFVAVSPAAPEVAPLQAYFVSKQHSRKRVEEVLQTVLGPRLPGNLVPGNGSSKVASTGSLSETRALHHETQRRIEIKGDAKSATVIQVNFSDALVESLPGLVIPQTNLQHGLLDSLSAKQYRVVLFDQDFLQQELFPVLARKHLLGLGANEYQYAVLSAGRLLYGSDPALTAQSFATADVSESFFKLRLEARDRIFLRQFGAPPAEAARVSVAEQTKEQAPKEQTPKEQTPKEQALKEQNKEPQKSYAVGIYTNEVRIGEKAAAGAALASALPESLPGLLKQNSEGAWKLVIKHRAGSLEAAVAKVRQRNLALSGGVLLLLGVSVGFIVLTSRRAQSLAAKQMEFVAGVSHELRTPLAVICSAAENLADGVVENRDQIKRYGSLIRDEGRRLTGMVEQVLEYAGAQSGKKTYELRPTAPAEIVADALTALHLPLTENGFLIEQDVAAALPPIAADAAALSRALQNLLSNGMKYSGESRWLGLRAHVAKTPPGEEVRFVVTDRGLGIAPAELPHIFEPFYRGREVSAAQIHGNGLGLSLVKHILDAHGGRVSVESHLGQGSTFTLHLPVVREAAATTPLLSNEYEQATATR